MPLHVHKQLIDQVDLMAILQELLPENDNKINFFGKNFVL